MKKIGLIGFGCVGQGLYLLLNSTNYNKARIEKIVVKNKDKTRIAPSELIHYNYIDVIDNDDIDIIIEAIDDVDIALDIAKRTLLKGKAFISANKKMLANNLDELQALAKLNAAPFRYEAAVCGAIPIVQIIDEYFSNDPLLSVRGIFNGTSNYILSKIFNENVAYKLALKQAQDLGFAETDPTSDVGGYDPKYKLSILTYHAFGAAIDPKDILNFGIDHLTEADILYAKERNLKIKLVPSVHRVNGELIAYVLPEFVKKTDALYNVENEFNGVQLESGFAGQQFYYGRGAGSFPTAAAVAADLNKIVNNQNYILKKPSEPSKVADDKEVLIEVYARYANEAIQRILKFRSVTEGLFTEESRQMVGYISLKELKEIAHLLKRERVSIIATGKRKVVHSNVPETEIQSK